MDNRLKVAIAVSQNYYTILDRRKRYARHIDTLNAMKPDIEMTEIPMAPRLVAYKKKSEDYRKSQKKLDDECIAMLKKTYREREMARRHQKRPGTTRDWVAELGTIRAGKKSTPSDTFASNQPQLRPLRSQRSYRTPAAAKIIFPDDNEQITASEIYEPTGLEDGMQVTDQGPASARSPRGNNYVSFGQYPIAPPNQPKSARNYRNSGTIKEPVNDSSSRSKRKVLVSQTQTEPESQEYESDYLVENDGQTGQNKISTLGDTFESINSTLANTGKKNSESEKESFDNTEDSNKEKSEKENESENDKDKSDKENESDKEANESEKEESKKSDEDDEEKEDKSENNGSEKEEKESDDMKSDFDSTAKSSDLNSTTKSDLNSTMKSDFDDEDDDDKSEDKKDDDDDDDEDKKDDDDDDDDADKSEDKKDDDDDDEDKSEDKKDDDDDDEDKSEEKDDDDDDEEKESDPFAD